MLNLKKLLTKILKAIAGKVSKSGDTMTGTLTVQAQDRDEIYPQQGEETYVKVANQSKSVSIGFNEWGQCQLLFNDVPVLGGSTLYMADNDTVSLYSKSRFRETLFPEPKIIYKYGVEAATSTWTTIMDTGTLERGSYLILFAVDCESNNVGTRRLLFDWRETSVSGTAGYDLFTFNPVAGADTSLTGTFVTTILKPEGLPYYLRVWQNSGSTLSMSPSRITIIRLR